MVAPELFIYKPKQLCMGVVNDISFDCESKGKETMPYAGHAL